jgi:asparagine synthase (glutamine-hydrolysing)
MCGIAGFIDQGGYSPTERSEILDRMCRIQTHRGPDDQGTVINNNVALGIRRLSIIDLKGGHQPISNEDASVTIVFNGEIYNYRELKYELELCGHRFATNSDTESIVHAYEEYGSACPSHLRGMFAFALWDESTRTLFIARDRVGKKPLYYTVTRRGTFVFGSELKSLLEHPEVTREVEPAAIDAYLTLGYVPDPLSIFHGVRKLPPGYYLTFADGRVSTKQYWDFDYSPMEVRDEEKVVDELRALLAEAVRVRLVADVPLGAFLSGGIDSSSIVGLMAKNMDQPVKTFSIGFQEDSYNELKYARLVANHFGTEHHEFIVTPEICGIVDQLAWHFDEPFADQSSLPTYMVSKLAREYVTVILSGDGGDELFAGYTRYAIDRSRSGFAYLPSAFRRRVMQPLSRLMPHQAWGRNYVHNISLDPLDRYADAVSVFTKLNKKSLYTYDFRDQLDEKGSLTALLFKDIGGRVKTGEPLDQLLYIDSKTYLPGDILTKVDRMSMAVSLEARAPLLDHKLIEFVSRIPARLKMRGFEAKYILKRAVKGLVPDEVLSRPKQGFGVPIERWINDQLHDRIRETLREPRTRERGYVDPRYVEVLLDEHTRGRRDHSTGLWALLMLELWHRNFVDGGKDHSFPAIDSTLVAT